MRDVQQDSLAKLLVVDDEPSIRTSIAQVLTNIGYFVQSAQDGFSALAEIRKMIPDIILSDLNMPGMSGFEFLSIVRRRFPSIRVIAMSRAFSGNEVPQGIAADAFFQKGSGIRSLLMIIRGLPKPKSLQSNLPASSSPLSIQLNGDDASGEPYVSISCPECLRTFRQDCGGPHSSAEEVNCIYCGNTVSSAIVEPADRSPASIYEGLTRGKACRSAIA